MSATVTGLQRDSVVNVTAMVTLNKIDLADWVGRSPTTTCSMSTEGSGWSLAYSRSPGHRRVRVPIMTGLRQS